jgi:hypothetical protein
LRIVLAALVPLLAAAAIVLVANRPSRGGAPDQAALQRDAAALIALEAPLRRDLKRAYIAPSTHTLARAQADADGVTAWLARHPAYVDANRSSVGCLFTRLARLTRPGLAEAITCLQGE